MPWSLFQAYVVVIAGIRRLHDLGRSWQYLLLASLPVGSVLMLLHLLLAPGKADGDEAAADDVD